MKIKAASGIKRFREEYRFGKWFGKLYPVITYRESSQPGQSFEASALNGDRKVFFKKKKKIRIEKYGHPSTQNVKRN